MNLLHQAREHREGGDYEAALSLYRGALEREADTPLACEAHVEMGTMLGFMGEFEQSVASLRESTRRWPRSPLAHLNLGKTLLMLSEYAPARQSLEAAATLDPGGRYGEEAQKQIAVLRQYGY